MTPSSLIHELAEGLKVALANFKLQAEYQRDKKVSVYESYVPLENFNNETFLPMVSVELRGVEDTSEGSFATVGMIIGIYGGENSKYGSGRNLLNGFADFGDGYRDLNNIAETIRQYLLGLPSRILAGKFPLVLPLTYVPQPDQPLPFFYGELVAQFEIGQPIFHLNYDKCFEESKVAKFYKFSEGVGQNASNIYRRKQ